VEEVFLITDLLLGCRPCHWWAKNWCFPRHDVSPVLGLALTAGRAGL